jgi:leucyl aminopeptidase
MKNIIIKFINTLLTKKESINSFLMSSTTDLIEITINIYSLKNHQLMHNLNKIQSIIKLSEYDKISIEFDSNFDSNSDESIINTIITKLHDIIYKYKIKSDTKISYKNISSKSKAFISELDSYKDQVMDPNKNPNTYLQHIKQNIPKDYKIEVFKLSSDPNFFPLTQSVGKGSSFEEYFALVKPKKINPKLMNIFLVGKAVTYDSGGLNLKGPGMEEMKTDMTGSAIVTSVINLLSINKYDQKFNIYTLNPIVENMIGNLATRPGMVVKTMNGKTVEIVNTDAEGRLCMADALEYIMLNLIKNLDHSKCLIIDVATLTGNANLITSGVSCIAMCNPKGHTFMNDLIKTGENIAEYVDFLKLRPEYSEYLSTPVADIANISYKVKCGCILGGTFLSYFVLPTVPWIHIDLGGGMTFKNNIAHSYGINLLYEFIRNIK